MTRNEVRKQFTNVDNRSGIAIIRDLGKFEAEPLYVPYFWDAGLDGAADEDVNAVWFFIISDEDRKQFPELEDAYGIALDESEQGFVGHTLHSTREEYKQALTNCEQEEADNAEEA